MKSLLPFYALPVLFFISLLPSQARTEAEVKNFLTHAEIPEFKVENISVSKALAAVDEMGALKQHKVVFANSVPQKTDTTRVSLDLKNPSAYDAIREICRLSGLEFTIKRDQVLIF